MVSELLPCICSCIPFICASFPSIDVVIMKASSIHGWTRAFNTSSLCRIASTCSLSALTYCIRASLCVRATIYAIPFMSSYCCYNSCASISKNCMFGSSYRAVRISNDSSNILVRSLTALLISSMPIMMVLVHCSLTSGGVECYAFNRSSTI